MNGVKRLLEINEGNDCQQVTIFHTLDDPAQAKDLAHGRVLRPEPVLVYSEPYVVYFTDSVRYETIVQLCNNTDKATVCSFSSRALLQNLRQTSLKSHDFRTSGEIPSGPPALPAFSEDFTFLYSSIEILKDVGDPSLCVHCADRTFKQVFKV